MNEDLSLKILESYVEIDKIHDDIINKIFDFITKANELVELSDDDYQIEKTIKLNKISLKSYILDSPCCTALKENNIVDYTIEELKKYINQYEKALNEDSSKYHLALSLYGVLETIEIAVDKKINKELELISTLFIDIKSINNISSNEYESLYYNAKNKIYNNYKNTNINEKAYNICIQILNDIFNFYISGYPTIPDEYLYKNDGLQ